MINIPGNNSYVQTLIIVITGTRVIAHRATTALPYSTIRHTECSMLLPQTVTDVVNAELIEKL